MEHLDDNPFNTTMQKDATALINEQGEALIYESSEENIVVRYRRNNKHF